MRCRKMQNPLIVSISGGSSFVQVSGLDLLLANGGRGRETNEEQIALVRDSFEVAIARREDFAEFFYACLFDLSPDMKALFKGDITGQAQRFMEMVAVRGERNDDGAGDLPSLGNAGGEPPRR